MKNRMKCSLAIALAILSLSLCACGNDAPAASPAPTQETIETPAVEATPETVPTDAAPVETENENKAIAESLIDEDVQKLYDAIGYPDSSDYASSCLGPGEDGELQYDGFTVYTYKENGKETIRVVL